MPPRFTPPPKSSFFPPYDAATYRDLLLFEERLKSNAASLQKRKKRYQLFLFQLLAIIAFLLYEVLAPPQSSILAIPYTLLLSNLLPEIYGPGTGYGLGYWSGWISSSVDEEDVAGNLDYYDGDLIPVHPYLTSGLLFVSVTTLVLFFASGMYSEKIGYANKYVPHANKALRSFNMYLNVRKPPLRSKFYWNPISFFFPRPDEHYNQRTPSSGPPSRPGSPQRTSRSTTPVGSGSGGMSRSSRAPSPNPDQTHITREYHSRTNSFSSSSNPVTSSASSINPVTSTPPSHRTNSTTPTPLSGIPPSKNPRGELIFSSKIDKSFRDAYEKYRAAFERRREEREREERRKRVLAKVYAVVFWWRAPSKGGDEKDKDKEREKEGHQRTISTSSYESIRGERRISRGGTPPGFRQRSQSRGPGEGRSGTPPQSGASGSGPVSSSPGRTRSGRVRRERAGDRERTDSESSVSRRDDDMRTLALERSLGLSAF
ncbi:hypothetical protein VKT23_013437 [Stygiomarasmius scandens]|uniref:Transmembrane protein 188 n=1 Tax=Marasmiellus scandens TaxID=2682957 RepID=A0ABR1J8Q1_9AGAR